MTGLDSVKERLSLVSPLQAYQAGGRIERLIKHDMRALIQVASLASSYVEEPSLQNLTNLEIALKDLGSKL